MPRSGPPKLTVVAPGLAFDGAGVNSITVAESGHSDSGPVSMAQMLDRVNQLALSYFEEANPVEGLTPRQYFLLEAIDAHPGSSQTVLIGLTGIDRSTLADLVTRMTIKGLVERLRSPTDGRTNCVSLTDKGKAAITAARPAVRAADERLLGMLSGSKRAGLVAALERLLRRSSASTLDAVPASGLSVTSEDPGPGARPKSKAKGKKKKKKQADRDH